MIMSLQQLRDATSTLHEFIDGSRHSHSDHNMLVSSVRPLTDDRRLKTAVCMRAKSDGTQTILEQLCPIDSRCDHSTHDLDWCTLASFDNVVSGVRIGDRHALGRVACFVYVPYLTDSYAHAGTRFLRCVVYALTRGEFPRGEFFRPSAALLDGHDLDVAYYGDSVLARECGFDVLESFVPVGMMAFDIGTSVIGMYEFRDVMSAPSALRRCADSGVSVAANEAEFERRGEWRCASRDVIPDGCVRLGEWSEQLLVKDCFENEVVLVAPSDTVYVPMECHRMVRASDVGNRLVRVSLFSFKQGSYSTEVGETFSVLFGARMYHLYDYEVANSMVPYVAHIHAKRIWKPDVVLDKHY